MPTLQASLPAMPPAQTNEGCSLNQRPSLVRLNIAWHLLWGTKGSSTLFIIDWWILLPKLDIMLFNECVNGFNIDIDIRNHPYYSHERVNMLVETWECRSYHEIIFTKEQRCADRILLHNSETIRKSALVTDLEIGNHRLKVLELRVLNQLLKFRNPLL